MFSFTGIIYLSITTFLGAFVYRLVKVFQKQRSDVAKLFLYGFIIFFIFCFIATIITLFFPYSFSALKITVLAAILLQSLGSMFLTQALFPLIFPKIPLKLIQGFIIILILIAGILYYFSGHFPFLEPNGFINWNIPFLVGGIRFLIMAPFFVPALFVFFRQIKSENKEVRKKAIIFTVGLGVGLIFIALLFLFTKGSGIVEAVTLFFAIFILGFLTTLPKEPKSLKLGKINE